MSRYLDMEASGAGNSLGDLEDKFKQILRDSPEKMKEFHKELAFLLKTYLEQHIVSSGLNDSRRHIRSTQVARYGRGGYAAVSPLTYTDLYGLNSGKRSANNPNAITAYLEGGHKIRKPRRRIEGRAGSRKYYPRIHLSAVRGFHFYAKTIQEIEEDWIMEQAEELAWSIIKVLERAA